MTDKLVKDADRVIDLLRRLGETHRPVLRRDTEAYGEQYQVQCRACDGNSWKNWQPGDPDVSCDFWREYSAFWRAD